MPKEQVSSIGISKKKKFNWLPLAIGLVSVIVLLSLVFLYIKTKKPKENVIQVVETPGNVYVEEQEIIEEAIEEVEPEIVYLEKEETKIQVLNANGMPGLAGKVKSVLVDLGYTAQNIDTANADEIGEEYTYVKYSDLVSEKCMGELNTYLKEEFAEVNASVSKDLEELPHDIIISIGDLVE